MPYRVKQDGATIKKEVGKKFNRVARVAKANDNTPVEFPVYRSQVYLKGDIIPDEDVAPVHVEAYEAGDKHILSLIERIEDEAPKKKVAKKAAKKDSE